MKFTKYVASLPNPKKDLLEEIQKKTGAKQATIYNWMNGDREPRSMKHKEIIAEIVGSTPDELWPQTKE